MASHGCDPKISSFPLPMFDRSRRRLAYWFTLSTGSMVILFAFTVYHRQAKEQIREFDAQVYAQTKRVECSFRSKILELGFLPQTYPISSIAFTSLCSH